jgi:hypothetical protein
MEDLEGEQEAQLEKARVNITPSLARASAAGVRIPGVPRQDRWALRSSARIRTTPFRDASFPPSEGQAGKAEERRKMAGTSRMILFIGHRC